MAQVFTREVDRVAKAGATVLLSSHILSEVEDLCDRVSIIRAGKVVESGTLADLRHLTRTEIAFVHDAAQDVSVRAIPGGRTISWSTRDACGSRSTATAWHPCSPSSRASR